MIRKLRTPAEIAAAVRLKNLWMSDEEALQDEYLSSIDARIMAVDYGRPVEVGESHEVAAAFVDSGARNLIAIVTEELTAGVMAYALQPTPSDLLDISNELVGLGFILTDELATRCTFFTIGDFKVVAGPEDFVVRLVGDPSVARATFLDLNPDPHDVFNPGLERVIRQMDWAK